jgi:hypothetical protein
VEFFELAVLGLDVTRGSLEDAINHGRVASPAIPLLQSCSRIASSGAEWAFAQNWSAKLEYLYIASMGSGVSTDHLNTIRAGIN